MKTIKQLIWLENFLYTALVSGINQTSPLSHEMFSLTPLKHLI